MVRTILIFVVIGVFLSLMGKFLNFYMADVYYTASKRDLENGRLESSGDNIIRAMRLNKNEPAYKRQRAKILLATLIWVDEQVVKEEVKANLEDAIAVNPKNLATLRNSVPLYYFLASGNTDQNYLPVTRNYYLLLKNTYDNDLGIFTDVAKYEKKLGLKEEFGLTKKRAEELRPDVVEWHESFED